MFGGTRLCSFAFLVGIASSLPATVTAQALDRTHFIRLAASVVKVEVQNRNGSYSLGTAVAIAPGRVVTNCHVTRDARLITLVKGALRWPAIAQSADLEHDLCILEAPTLEAMPVRMGSARSLRIGQRVGAMGFTGGIGMAFRDGMVGALHRLDGSKVIQSTTAFTSGASGGALFDNEGRLVGILTFRLPGAPGYYFSAPVDWVAARVTAVEGFTGIAPLAATRPFWQHPPPDLPYFMRAALLEAGDQWPELLKLAEAWAVAEDDSPEPWITRGKAYLRLDRREAAAEAFSRATVVEPASGDAWFNLGVTCFHLGETAELQRAHLTLSRLNPDLAKDLAVISGLSIQ
jgi:hypothetical protein